MHTLGMLPNITEQNRTEQQESHTGDGQDSPDTHNTAALLWMLAAANGSRDETITLCMQWMQVPLAHPSPPGLRKCT